MRRLAALVAVMALAGCGGTPTSPPPGGGAPTVPASGSFGGAWQFEYRIAECTGERHCGLSIGGTEKIAVRLLAAGGAYVGVVSLGGDNIDISGTLGADGSVMLTGVRLPAIPNDYQIEVGRLHLRNGESGLAGSFEYSVTAPVAKEWPFRHMRKSGPLISATRVGDIPPTNNGFAGTWVGRAYARDCSSVGWYPCYPLEQNDVWGFKLTVAESGGRATGLFENPVVAAVEGSVSGATVILQGIGHSNGSGHTKVTTVRPSSLTRDVLGRLTGSLSIEMRWMWNDGRVSTSDFRVIELLDVVLKLPS